MTANRQRPESDSPQVFDVTSLEQMHALAQRLAKEPPRPLTICLNGSLGAGKTQFVRFFAASLGVAQQDVTSPTYVLLQRYPAEPAIIYHFDFYRLDREDEVWDLGIDELYEQSTWILIEWADKFPRCLPDDRLDIQLSQAGGQRSATLNATGPGASRAISFILP